MELDRPIYGVKNAKESDFCMRDLFIPHLDSFNYFLDHGLRRAIKNIPAIEFEINDQRVSFHFIDAEISIPLHSNNTSKPIFPSDCRIRGTTYSAEMTALIGWSINGEKQTNISRMMGHVPIMVKSKRCNIQSFCKEKLVKVHEEENEQGGYFITSGIERILRLLVVQRRNYPLALSRPSWKSKTSGMTEYGVSLRSVNLNNLAVTNILHYQNDSTILLSISHRRKQYFIPVLVILRLLVDYSDFHIFSDIMVYDPTNSLLKESVKCMFSHLRSLKIVSKIDALKYIGSNFRIKLNLPDWYSDEQAAEFLVSKCLCIHLDKNTDKYNMLVFMIHKLVAVISKKIALESPDTLNNQEVILPGQVYQMVLIDKLESWLSALKLRILAIMKISENSLSVAVINTAMGRCPDIGIPMEYFIKSGNINSRAGIGLPQANGFSVIADKLNYIRYLSHFRSIHRGSYFTKSYSVKVRKLLPESWGFLCPVHTPDGTPCGLLNHLSQSCKIVIKSVKLTYYMEIIDQFPMVNNVQDIDPDMYIGIHIDGRIHGYVSHFIANELFSQLKELKIKREDSIEIILVPLNTNYNLFPGIFIFSNPCRFSRAVMNLEYNCVEYIGSFEQLYLNIALASGEGNDISSHQEIDPLSILSLTASLTPFSSHNQSPRNMYQCQMMKQSMGVPCLNLKYRFDNKLYQLFTVQTPICHNKIYQNIDLDSYPIGFNAVLAVISYTGYDMEDAIIINKAAIDRGFSTGSIYKTERINLAEENSKDKKLVFGARVTDKCYQTGFVDIDGLPPVGRLIKPGDVYYSFYDVMTTEYHVKKSKLKEAAYIDDIAVINSDSEGSTCVNIRLRIPRNPIVGDKFSSRHGQKGILSIFWPAEDMPFSESGIVPDIIFNPHGFPSRMTIGMMIEIMASKAGALEGKFFDCSPFREDDTPVVDYFGQKLSEAGYNYYGSERMYSGTNGLELEASIFAGIVYYQRLRHMVSDKYQVRTTGPVDNLTHQPIGGRVRGGGVRFGEMERDCLISHGCSYLLKDRLLDCSDKTLAFICEKCGDLLATKFNPERNFNPKLDFKPPSVAMNVNTQQYLCLLCNSSAHIKPIYIPYVLRYLLAELASMNIKLKFNF